MKVNVNIDNLVKNLNIKNQKIKEKLINQLTANKNNKTVNLPLVFKKLDPDMQQLILKTWLKMGIPLKEENITNFLQIKQNISTDIKPTILLKSTGFLLKNNLPLLPYLVEAIAINLDPEKPLSKKLITNIINTAHKAETNNKLNTNIGQADNNEVKNTLLTDKIRKLSIKLDQPQGKLAEELINYNQDIKQLLKELQINTNQNTNEILKHLLGEKLLNQNSESNTLLLSIEIPLLIEEKEDIAPLYLQIWKEHKQKKEKRKPEKNYRISFLLKLKNRGTVKADIYINNKKIWSKFWSDQKETQKLIAKNYDRLVDKLADIGYEMKKPEITKITDIKEIKENEHPFPEPLFEEKNITEEQIHFDIRI